MTTDTVPQAGGRRAVADGAWIASAAWPRAPACWPRHWPRCWSSSPPTPSSQPAQARRCRCAAATRVSFDRARLRRLHVDQRHRDRCWRAGRPASTPTAEDFAAALTELCARAGAQAARRRRGRRATTSRSDVQRRLRARRRRGRPRASPGPTSSRPPSSARTPTGAGCSRAVGTTERRLRPGPTLDVVDERRPGVPQRQPRRGPRRWSTSSARGRARSSIDLQGRRRRGHRAGPTT